MYGLGRSINTVWVFPALAAMFVAGAVGPAQTPGAEIEWPSYGNDKGGQRYSTARQITSASLDRVDVAWTYRTGISDGPPGRSQSTPVFVDGMLYVTSPLGRVAALDPDNGTAIWTFDPRVDPKPNYPDRTNRGVAVWRDQSQSTSEPCARRVFYTPVDGRLIALDSRTGHRCADFGANGEIDLSRDVLNGPEYTGEYATTSPPTLIRDLVVVGSGVADNQRANAPSGVVRAFDARTGQLRWSWDPVPRTSEKSGYDTWSGPDAHASGAANVWSIGSADEERDLLFLPTSSASPDFYGGTRIGTNLYSTSVVALRGSTGALVWHFQTVHHDIFDYDVPAQPVLFSFGTGADVVPAVLQVTKMGHVFVLNRLTGEPLLPVEERPVPASSISSEKAWPRQPFPLRPPPIVPQRLSASDAWGATGAEREWCRDRMSRLRSDGIFTPPSLEGSIIFPGNLGGAHWGGAAVDGQRGIAIIPTNRLANVITLIPRESYKPVSPPPPGVMLGAQAGTPYGLRKERLVAPSGTPCNPPPWGMLTGVELSTGTIKWETPLGFLPWLRDRPEARQWGSFGLGGAIITASGLAFIANTLDGHLRAFDVSTGKQLWERALPVPALATPMTYQSADGRQYVVISAGGHPGLGTPTGDSVIAFSLR